MFDLLIKGGQIIDGTGNPGYYASVVIQGDKLWLVRGDISSVMANKVIDATGRVVCPGFVDIHTHSALMILANPYHEPKVCQGGTTELIGIDGMGYAPVCSDEDLRKHMRINAGADGAPPLEQRWLSVAEYLSQFNGKVACNIAYVIGNSPIRTATVGWENRPATKDEINQMKSLIRQGMAEGAYGISTGLDYPPGSYASTEELVALCQEANQLGGIYHTHVRYSLGDKFLDPYREAIEIGRRSGIPVHLTHVYQRLPIRGGHHELLNFIEDARHQGMDVTFDGQPYPYGSTTLLAVIPQWAWSGGPDALLALMRSREGRKRLKEVALPLGSLPEWWLTNFKLPHNKRWEGKSINEIAEGTGQGIIDTICDLLIEEELQISAVLAGFNAATQRFFICHPLHMVGSDALLIGDYVNPRTYGTFPYLLGSYVREERFLTLPEAIRHMTSAPAQRLGLRDRGILRDGFKADLVIFDPTTVKALATRTQPKQYPIGIDYVIVNGVIVVDHGKHTGALPGRALHRGQD